MTHARGARCALVVCGRLPLLLSQLRCVRGHGATVTRTNRTNEHHFFLYYVDDREGYCCCCRRRWFLVHRGEEMVLVVFVFRLPARRGIRLWFDGGGWMDAYCSAPLVVCKGTFRKAVQ